ncbi:hypothetical protein [Quadrisphaera setariae]|nr:hypothetical protein [Quadrisphaera setariae]
MVAGALVMAWIVVSALAAVLVGAAIHVADANARRQRSAEPFHLP